MGLFASQSLVEERFELFLEGEVPTMHGQNRILVADATRPYKIGHSLRLLLILSNRIIEEGHIIVLTFLALLLLLLVFSGLILLLVLLFVALLVSLLFLLAFLRLWLYGSDWLFLGFLLFLFFAR